MLRSVVVALVATGALGDSCVFCTYNAQGQAVSFDLSNINNATVDVPGYAFTTPCGLINSLSCGRQDFPMTQSCKGLGTLANITINVTDPTAGFVLTLHGGFDNPPMPSGRKGACLLFCSLGGVRGAPRPPTHACTLEHPPVQSLSSCRPCCSGLPLCLR